jgi:predicted nucleotide-binding protein (sugar kinase/HSP70/actin superfamily)
LIGLSRNFKVVRVGIPRALSYYQYYPGWKAFFESLGVETVVSPPTNKAIFSAGNSRAVAETCLPVKIFFGHVIYLADKCDYMFVPALRSLGDKAYYCSKFIGLPDMTRALIPECPPVLDPEKAHLTYRRGMSDKGITPIQALDERQPGEDKSYLEPDISPGLRVAVVGHQYVIYDDHINHRLISRLQTMGVRVLTPEMVEQETLDIALKRLGGAPHWSFEADIIGAGEYYLEAKVNGIISVAVFGCGPDSMMIEMVRHRASELRIPFLHLSLDEHTSDGGLLTRLEAFLDMVRRRGKVCA